MSEFTLFNLSQGQEGLEARPPALSSLPPLPLPPHGGLLGTQTTRAGVYEVH